MFRNINVHLPELNADSAQWQKNLDNLTGIFYLNPEFEMYSYKVMNLNTKKEDKALLITFVYI